MGHWNFAAAVCQPYDNADYGGQRQCAGGRRYIWARAGSLYRDYQCFRICDDDDDYREKSDKWEERYGKVAHRKEKESVHNRLQNYQKEHADQHSFFLQYLLIRLAYPRVNKYNQI